MAWPSPSIRSSLATTLFSLSYLIANADGVLLDIPLLDLGVKAPAAERGRAFLPYIVIYKSWLALSLCKTLEITSFSLIEFLASLSY